MFSFPEPENQIRKINKDNYEKNIHKYIKLRTYKTVSNFVSYFGNHNLIDVQSTEIKIPFDFYTWKKKENEFN